MTIILFAMSSPDKNSTPTKSTPSAKTSRMSDRAMYDYYLIENGVIPAGTPFIPRAETLPERCITTTNATKPYQDYGTCLCASPHYLKSLDNTRSFLTIRKSYI
jgi:hypothetical protein